MASHVPASPELLREFLRARLTPERLRRIASADYDRDGEGIAAELAKNLATGEYGYEGDGNPYEVALLQRHDSTGERPLNELFGAWWMGAFCSEPDYFVLIENLAAYGVESLLHMVVRGCGELGEDASKAAHASIPFVLFVKSRTPDAELVDFAGAIGALEAVERLGAECGRASRYQEFVTKYE